MSTSNSVLRGPTVRHYVYRTIPAPGRYDMYVHGPLKRTSAFVEHIHRAVSSLELRYKADPCFFNGRNGMLAGHAGILLQEIIQRITAFEIIGQDLEWNTGTAKDRLTSHDIWIFDDDLFHKLSPLHKTGFNLTCSASESESAGTRVIPALSLISLPLCNDQTHPHSRISLGPGA